MKKLLVLAVIVTIVIASCKKTDVAPPPTVDIHELGNPQKIAYAGADLHMDVDIVAAGIIDNIKVQITPAATGTGWIFTKIYTGDYAGKKNAEFHEHIDIPADAKVGNYKLVVIVTDKSGKSTLQSDNFKIEGADPTKPSVTGLALALSSNKNELTVTGTVNAPNKIAKIEAEIKDTKWPKKFAITDAAMVGQTTYALNKKLDIAAAPAGHYHIYVLITDQAGKSIEYENHFDK